MRRTRRRGWTPAAFHAIAVLLFVFSFQTTYHELGRVSSAQDEDTGIHRYLSRSKRRVEEEEQDRMKNTLVSSFDARSRAANNSPSTTAENGTSRIIIHKPITSETALEDYSSIDYMACCGLGHRLGRMADAFHVAIQLLFELRGFWGFCPSITNNGTSSLRGQEIYSSLFDPYSPQELTYVNSTNLRGAFANNVPGYTENSVGHEYGCLCTPDKIASDLEFYTSLRNRFKRRKDVDHFVQEHFAGKLSLGLHVRAGNGEEGDFEEKNRRIQNSQQWIRNVSLRILELAAAEAAQGHQEEKAGVVLFLATDTPSYIDLFRDELKNASIPVVVWEQDRPEEGSGVFFGQNGAHIHHQHPNKCIRRWEDTLMDQILLSSTNVVISGASSTFTQTLPLSLAFGRGSTEAQLAPPYCEVRGKNGEALTCFDSYTQWCCDDDASREKQVKRVRFVSPLAEPPKLEFVTPRPQNRECHPYRSNANAISYCLPHDYSMYE